jgi:hypothetical protein
MGVIRAKTYLGALSKANFDPVRAPEDERQSTLATQMRLLGTAYAGFSPFS